MCVCWRWPCPAPSLQTHCSKEHCLLFTLWTQYVSISLWLERTCWLSSLFKVLPWFQGPSQVLYHAMNLPSPMGLAPNEIFFIWTVVQDKWQSRLFVFVCHFLKNKSCPWGWILDFLRLGNIYFVTPGAHKFFFSVSWYLNIQQDLDNCRNPNRQDEFH